MCVRQMEVAASELVCREAFLGAGTHEGLSLSVGSPHGCSKLVFAFP